MRSLRNLRTAATPFLLVILAGVLCGGGCSTVSKLGTSIAESQGALTAEQAESINKSAEAVDRARESLTPEQEYYIGRSVAATVLASYKIHQDERAVRYLNLLGQTLAQASDRPETFGGYRFLLLDSDEINAFAAPGGFVMISRGMVRCCRSEDALAAVLAHEIGHVAGQHGLKAIKKGRLASALTLIGTEAARNLGDEQVAALTEKFGGAIGDVTSTLMNNGYARGLEKEADAAAVTILRRVGYNPRALVEMLAEMKKRLRPGGLDFARTHPDPADRIDDIEGMIKGSPAVVAPAPRQQRFERAMGSV